jgi:UDP-GlcNAc:undecaprenyl-phosphate/decaprenyl-phosphate GlcNAc-1-phosphate transferase
MLDYYQLFLAFLLTVVLSAVFTYFWKKQAIKWKLLDLPNDIRKIHRRAIALGGGWGIFLAFFIILLFLINFLVSGDLNYNHWLGFFIGALIIMVGGTLDDRYNLKAWQQLLFPLLAIISVLLGGVEISNLSNPFGGLISFASFSWLSVIIIFLWLLGMMYTTKLLDGIDGLVSGLGAIGAFIIFLFTSLTNYYQPDIALASLIFSAACLGFLYFNFSPASIFLGEGGSLLIGYVLGVLAIISGAKIAITLLIIGLPALDVAWTIIRRLKSRKNPFSLADKKHLHHRLLDLGLSHKQTAFFYYLLAIFFGLSGLFLQSQGKLLALSLLFILMLLIIIYFSSKQKKLLLHICCAPCASYTSVNFLNKDFDLTWYFYNPNLLSQKEFDLRLLPVKQAAAKFKIKLIVEPYNPINWQKKIKGREEDKERGKRCLICYTDRLEKTAKLAKKLNFDFFTSSLLASPYKDKKAIDRISMKVAKIYGVDYLKFDWSANQIWQKSMQLAKSENWYRQNFCGCFFSQRKKA